ncbi:hypothetical protein HDU77_007952 [Chytriomyces hyalinus]|nr:hypothetical protein HDU77_007952 [Chytriomyces hyalinus]
MLHALEHGLFSRGGMLVVGFAIVPVAFTEVTSLIATVPVSLLEDATDVMAYTKDVALEIGALETELICALDDAAALVVGTPVAELVLEEVEDDETLDDTADEYATEEDSKVEEDEGL